jgi:hypothetical protein
MTITEIQKAAFANAKRKGFYEGIKSKRDINFAERVALIHSEASEALEAHRSGKAFLIDDIGEPYRSNIESTIDEMPDRFKQSEASKHIGFELADAVIRICDTAEAFGLDLDWYIRTKMAYNATRPYKHNKNY